MLLGMWGSPAPAAHCVMFISRSNLHGTRKHTRDIDNNQGLFLAAAETYIRSFEPGILHSPLLPGANKRVIVAAALVSLILINVVIAVSVAVGVEFNFRSLPT